MNTEALIKAIEELQQEIADLKIMMETQEEIMESQADSALAIQDTNKFITYFLMELNIPASFTGFKYLSKAIELTYERGYIPSMGELYKEISKHFRASPSQIERSMRYAIDVSWDKNGEHPFHKEERFKLTNKRFIMKVVEKMKVGQ